MKNHVIVSEPHVLGGKPIVAGTRITVEFILDNLFLGKTPGQLIAKNPNLTFETIDAAKKFVLDAVENSHGGIILRVPIRIRHLIAALEPHELATQIKEAFGNERLGKGASLRQLDIMDGYGADSTGRVLSKQEFQGLKSLDEINSWAAITLEDLQNYRYLSHADAETFRYYIPAHMISGLTSLDNDAVFHLCPTKESWDYKMWQYSLLDHRQKHTIVRYLWHLLDLDIGSYAHKEIERAFDSYWFQFWESPVQK